MVHLGERDGALMQIGKQWRSFLSADNVLVLEQIGISCVYLNSKFMFDLFYVLYFTIKSSSQRHINV